MEYKKIQTLEEIPHMVQIAIERWVESPKNEAYQLGFANFIMEWIHDLKKPYEDVIFELNRMIQDGHEALDLKVAALSDTVLGKEL